MIKKCLLILSFTFISANAFFNSSDNCFIIKDSTNEIAQQLRQEADIMKWDIGKIKSFSIAGIIKGKKAIYPDGKIEVCLKEIDGDLKFKMKSDSKDSKKEEWHFLSSSKKGWF